MTVSLDVKSVVASCGSTLSETQPSARYLQSLLKSLELHLSGGKLVLIWTKAKVELLSTGKQVSSVPNHLQGMTFEVYACVRRQ